jgi:hypothetical protein
MTGTQTHLLVFAYDLQPLELSFPPWRNFRGANPSSQLFDCTVRSFCGLDRACRDGFGLTFRYRVATTGLSNTHDYRLFSKHHPQLATEESLRSVLRSGSDGYLVVCYECRQCHWRQTPLQAGELAPRYQVLRPMNGKRLI